jgi:hypothetical protein
LNQLNNTGAPQSQGLIIGAQSYIDVRGYTNAEPDTLIQVVVDADFNQPDALVWKNAIVTAAQGEPGGDLREWKALVPLKLYDMPSCGTGKCEHFVSARTGLSNDVISTATFYIYDSPEGTAIPNKTIRYVSGKYGPQELMPTPTPVVITNIVKQTVVVTQTVTIPVTPSNEQVKAQQDTVISEKITFYGIVSGVSLVVLIVAGYVGYAWIRGRKKNQKPKTKSEIDNYFGR